MKKCLLSIISVVLCMSLMTPMQAPAVQAQDHSHANNSKETKKHVHQYNSEVEVVEERTANSKVFLQEDGAHRMEISSEPIHVQNERTKKWEMIDNTLVEKGTGRFHNKKNDFDASFSTQIQPDEPIVSIEQQGKTVEIDSIMHNDDPAAMVEATVEENKITYKDVYTNTDIIYTVGSDKIKEDVILKEKPSDDLPLSYDFQFNIKGMSLEETEDGYLYLLDKDTEEWLFAIEKPFMMDSFIPEGYVTFMEGSMPEGALSDAIEMKASQEGDLLFLSLAPSMDWLMDSARVYPVTIDPTIKIYQPRNDLNDTTIRSALPDTTGGADTELGAGLYQTSSTTNIVRSLIQFDTDALPKGAKVMSAQLNLHLSSVWNDTPTSIQLFEVGNTWEENRATWNRRTLSSLWSAKGGDYKQPSLASQTVGVLDPTLAEPPMYKWAIPSDIAQKWSAQPGQNFGVMLKAQNESLATYKKFYSGDASGTTGALKYSPKLSIVYYPISRLGLEGYWSYAEHGLSDGEGYVNLGTGNLAIEATDFSVVGRGNSGFSFSRTYNSKAVEDSPIGYGWSFIGSESVSEFPNKDVLYQDGDGTTHLFSYDASAAKYTAPPGTFLTLTKANADAFVLTDFNGNRIVFRDLIKTPEVQSRIYRIDYAEDRNINKVTYLRETDGRLNGISDATGRILSFTYTNGRIEFGSFEGVKKFGFTYDSTGRLKTSTVYSEGTIGSTTTYNYNANGELSGIVDANGQLTKYEYESGFLRKVTQPAISAKASDITYAYDIANFTASEFDADGQETLYVLNENYIIKEIIDSLGAMSSFTYDANYNMLTATDAKGNKTVNKYDAKGNLEVTTNELGSTVTYTHNNFSQPLTITDADGTTTYKYNSYGDVLEEINPLQEVTSYTYYEPYGNLKSMTPPDGVPETYEYDAMQNYPKEFTNALGRKTSIVNDKYGNAKEVTDPKGNKVSFEYNELEQLKSMTDEKGVKTSYEYDQNGNLKRLENAKGNVTSFNYGAQNQLLTRTEPLGQVTTMTYNALGQLQTTNKPDGATLVRTDYDANGQTVDIRINGHLKWHYEYDMNGNTESVKNGENNAITSFTYDKADKLKSITAGAQKIEYGYSLTETLTDIKGTSSSTAFTQRFAFDAADRLKNFYRNGSVQGAYDYYPTGEPQQRRYVNGIHTSYTYDTAMQMDTLKVTKGTTVLLNEKLGYDLNGVIETVTSSAGNKSFRYDKANQLEFHEISAAGLTESYTYDALGNREVKTTTKNGDTTVTSYGYDANNRLRTVGGQSYTYDQNGNRTKDGKHTYGYNKFDEMTSVKNAAGTTLATYTYDDQGRRASKTVSGQTTYYHYGDGINVLFETDQSGTITAEYLYDPEGYPLILSKGGQNYYYTYNMLKEITGLTNSSGAVVAAYTYDAWGNILSQSGTMAAANPIRYKGYRYDDETELYYLIARYYQPAEGVFLSLDPEGGDMDDPKTQNGYAYASSNPVMYTDPDGNYIWLAINAGFAVYDGYGGYKKAKNSGLKGAKLVRHVAGSAATGAMGGRYKGVLGIAGKSTKSMLKKAKNSKQPLTIFKQKNGWTTATYSVPATKLKGQARSVYVKSMKNGETRRFYKDSYNSDGSLKHRKFKEVNRK